MDTGTEGVSSDAVLHTDALSLINCWNAVDVNGQITVSDFFFFWTQRGDKEEGVTSEGM